MIFKNAIYAICCIFTTNIVLLNINPMKQLLRSLLIIFNEHIMFHTHSETSRLERKDM